jgi:hypothetical protein
MWNIGLRSKTVTVLFVRVLDLDLALAELELEQARQVSRHRRLASSGSVR